MGDGTIFSTGFCIGFISGLMLGLFLAITGAEQRVQELQAQAAACEAREVPDSATTR